MTAKEYLRFCGEITGMSRTETEERTNELLTLVGLAEETHRIKGFSRGMKQRLGIAQALLSRPKLLVCDEPTSALDPTGRKEILDILLAVKDQTTVLFSTHILSDVERICTDVAFLKDGAVDIGGKLSDIKTRYRSNEYMIEAENDSDTLILRNAFPEAKELTGNKVTFSEDKHSAFEVLRFVADHRISILRVERLEPSLEDLFLEVTKK
jgi:ABC-2 type transport system ATP-binding protein